MYISLAGMKKKINTYCQLDLFDQNPSKEDDSTLKVSTFSKERGAKLKALSRTLKNGNRTLNKPLP